MNLAISSFVQAGNLNKERLILKALKNLDVGSFAVFHSDISDEGSPVSGNKLAYWFPDVEVEELDLIVLYTKEGRNSTKKLESGSTAHFFYWGLTSPIWTPESGAVLIATDDWKWKRAIG